MKYQTLCKSRIHHAAKVIRVSSISSLVPLMRRGVKVIHLIRDPRGTYVSRSRLAMKNQSRIDNIKSYCDMLIEDLDTIHSLYSVYREEIYQALYVVRYEDLASRPLWYLYDIYKFLGVEPDANVINWAKDLYEKNLVGTKENILKPKIGYVTSTQREYPKQTAFSWRQRISEKLLNNVQTVCSGFFRKFGYTIYHSSKDRLTSKQEPIVGIGDLISGASHS